MERKPLIKEYREQATMPFYIRKLARSGSSRYLSVNTILPRDWEAVKIVVQAMSNEAFILKVTPIR